MKNIKYLLWVIALICIMSIFTGYPNLNFKALHLNKLTNENLNDVDKIRIYYGRPGQKGVTIIDKTEINKFVSQLNNYLVVEDKNAPIIVGYYQAADLYAGDKLIMNIIFNNPIRINGVSYKVIRGNMSSEEIDKYINH